MFGAYQIQITKKELTKLVTSKVIISSWEHLQKIITSEGSTPILYEISDVNKNFLVYFMTDNNYVHLSAWKEDTCYYFCEKNADINKNDSFDIGWNSFPSWTVVEGSNDPFKAIKLFLEEKQLADWANWQSEEVEL